MTEPTRREKVQAMLADEPGDTFLRYVLAMEWQKEDEFDKSIEGFRDLMADDPPYVPAYFMLGQLYARLGEVNPARTVLRDGIEHARTQGDTHAASEMSEFLAGLGELGE